MVCLLFSQLAVAAYACPTLSHSVSAAFSQAAASGDNDDEPCTEHETARPGLCVAYCNPTDLSLSQAQVDTPPVMLVALHPVPAQTEPAILIPAGPRFELPLRSHPPPLSVLHCCFRI
jgi:hypothetical protein